MLLVGDGHYDPRDYYGTGEPIYIPAYMEQEGVPGVSVALVRDGRVAWVEEFGVTNVLTGKPVTYQKRDFGTIQPDTIGTTTQRRGDISEQTGICIESDTNTIPCFRWQLGQTLQLM